LPVPLRSPTTRGEPSSVRAIALSSWAVSLLSASTFWKTFTINNVSSRRATRSKQSPRSPWGRERKKPVFAKASRVSFTRPSRFTGHSSCKLLYKHHGTGFLRGPGPSRPSNPLSRGPASPVPHAGGVVRGPRRRRGRHGGEHTA